MIWREKGKTNNFNYRFEEKGSEKGVLMRKKKFVGL